MADGPDSGFLARWSQRKAEARRQPADAAPAAPAAPSPATAGEPEPQLDLTTLPPIETLTAESDFAPFLVRGIPDALRQQALRRLWLVEPSVRDYVPLVEYNWDFTAPGYGDLLPSDDVQKLLKHILSEKEDAAPGTDSATAPDAAAVDAATLPPPGNVAGNVAGNPAVPAPAAVRLSTPPAAALQSAVPADPASTGESPAAGRVADAADSGMAPRLPRRHGGALPG